MCFVSRKKLNKIESDLQKLTDIIENKELVNLREESKELKELKDLLSKVRFKIKDVNYFEENETVQIRYELPVIELKLDADGLPDKNDFFYSVNMLELTDIESMKKVQEVLNRVKKVS